MHPYEVAQTLKFRHKHESIRLNFGSLYSVVDSLERRGLISAHSPEREGKRPERTVYEITAAGLEELRSWLTDLVVEPQKEYLQFEAALSLLGHFPPDEAVALLRQRAERLAAQIEERRAFVEAAVAEHQLPRVHVIEDEYLHVLHTAELTWLRGLIADIEDGSLDGLDAWRAYHPTKTTRRRRQ